MNVNLNEYIEQQRRTYFITNKNFLFDFTIFMSSNNWFGIKPFVENKTVYIDPIAFDKIKSSIDLFCSCYSLPIGDKVNKLKVMFNNMFPNTYCLFELFAETKSLRTKDIYVLLDFMTFYLSGEIVEATDKEIGELMDNAYDNLHKKYGMILSEFINWIHISYKTVYKKIYLMDTVRYPSNNAAFEINEYLEIIYRLFNEDYIQDHNMYYRAARNIEYANAWLYLSLHSICSLRDTDFDQLPHPNLPYSPEEVLRKIKSNEYSDKDAISVIQSLTYQLSAYQLIPNKTNRHSNVPSIKLFIPDSLEVHFGILFSISEAFNQMLPYKSPLIHRVIDYVDLKQIMGDEIAELFIYRNFGSVASAKTYLQMIQLITDQTSNDSFKVQGYMIASLARSHKSAYGEFSKTTIEYLKDAKLNGYSPEFVAKEMLERGVLSIIPSMLLKLISNESYQHLSVSSQTIAIKELGIKNSIIEKSIDLLDHSLEKAKDIVQSIYQSKSKEEIIDLLHNIGNGMAASKNSDNLCIMTGLKEKCPYDDRNICIGCDYEINTKTTILLMANEYRRLIKIYSNSNDVFEKEKSIAIIRDVILPKLQDLLFSIREIYGVEKMNIYKDLIKGIVDNE